MYYTVEVNENMKRKLHLFFGMFLALVLVSCAGGLTSSLPAPFNLAQDKPTSAPTSLPPIPSRVSPEALPEICNCFLRFDHITIEQGLSQSSIRVIFQDSRGFLWFGT